MGKEHRLAERRQAILAALEETGQLSVAELSTRFNVSEVTIRGDLEALSQQGLVLRTRGGALATNVLPEFSFDVRQQQFAEQKARIGRAAADIIDDGDTIALDASTTALAIIPHLTSFTELTVITYSLRVAMSLLRQTHVHVFMPGGRLRRQSIALVGQYENTVLTDFHARLGFFGARGLTLGEGLTDVALEEVQMKRTMFARCQTLVALIDSRKWGQIATTTFARLERMDTIITDYDAPSDLVDEIRGRDIEVILS
ncbi:MAG: DeoR/GlpR transcriptional regulator [Proteobacteria bacterium]|nr:DeoR/GlpR transcriptional regulator [Pseudomonadota bacterium]